MDKKTLLCIYECETLGYHEHFHSWEIQKTTTRKIVICTDKMTQQVLYPRKAAIQTYFITLKYAV